MWILLPALVFAQILPTSAWAEAPPAEGEHLRVGQRESQGGLEEIRQRLTDGIRSLLEPVRVGLEEVASVEEALERWFHPGAGRSEEVLLQRWLLVRGEEVIQEFMRRVAEDRGIPVEALGPYTIPILQPTVQKEARELQQLEQRRQEFLTDEQMAKWIPPEFSQQRPNLARRYYEFERLNLMAQVAIQRALGRIPVVDVGLGYVGTASVVVHANSVADSQHLPKVVPGKRYRSPIRESGMRPFFAIAYQRPSPSFYKIALVRDGEVPMPSGDPRGPVLVRQSLARGNLAATPLAGAIAVADIVLNETELLPERPVPEDPSEARIAEGPTLQLLEEVASLVNSRETLIIVVSTVTPGFTQERALPVVAQWLVRRGLVGSADEVLLGHAPQRMDPGPDWFGWLLFQREAAGVHGRNFPAGLAMKRYLDLLYNSTNRAHWELPKRPPKGGAYILDDSPAQVETAKGWENAWRYQLMGLGVPLLQSAEALGVNAWEVARDIARSRPRTHGLIGVIAALPGGFCVPNQLFQMISGVRQDLQRAGWSPAEVELQMQGIFRSPIMAAAVIEARGRDLVRDHLIPSLEEQGKRIERSKVLLAGVAFKELTDETRQAGSEVVARAVAHLGGRVLAVDPYVQYWRELADQDLSDPESRGYRLKNQERLRMLRVQSDLLQTVLAEQPDAVVLVTRHPPFIGSGQPEAMRTNPATGEVHLGLDVVELVAHAYGRTGNVVVDTFDFLSDREIRMLLALDWGITGFGKGHIWARLRGQVDDQTRIAAVEALLKRLQQKVGTPLFDPAHLDQAIRTQTRRVEALRARAGLEENAELLEARFQVENARLALAFEVDPERRQVLEAQVRWQGAWVDLLETQQGIQAHGEIPQLEKAVQETKQAFDRLAARYGAGGAAHVRGELVDPTLRTLSVEAVRLARLINVLTPRLQKPEGLLLPERAALLARVAGHLGTVLDDTRRLHANLDRLIEELVPEQDRRELARALRHAEFDPSLAVPQPIPAGEIPVQGAIHPLVPSTVYRQRPDGRLEREVSPVTAQGKPNPFRLSVKTLPDMGQSDAALAQKQWGKYSMQVPLNEVEAEVVDYEEFPDFHGLPWEFRLYLRGLIARGRVLSTLHGYPQDQVGFLMDVNLDPRTPDHRRGRGGILFFLDNRQPLVVRDRATGHEFITELKAAGTHLGGSPAALAPREAQLRAGRTSAGEVGRSLAVQIPGHMGSGAEVVPMMRLRVTDAFREGRVPRAIFRVRFRYREDPSRTEYEIVFRGAPTNQRLGQRFVGAQDPDLAEVASRLGEAAAELLALGMSSVHIALNGDNVMGNGYPTDTGSFVELFDERDPYGAFSSYFGFYLSFILYTFEQMDSRDTAHPPHSAHLAGWAKGFLDRLARAEEPAKVWNPSSLAPFAQPTPEQLADPESQYVQPLMDALWQHYLPYRILENRLRFGYDPTAESAYTSANEAAEKAMFHPESESHARAFLRNQREVLRIARHLIQKEGYPPLLYPAGPKAGRPFDFEAALRELDEKEQQIAQLSGDYSSIYALSFYPPRRSDRYDVVDVEGAERETIHWLKSAQAFEKPDTAAAARLRRQRTAEQTAGLEETWDVQWRFLPTQRQANLGVGVPSHYMLEIQRLLQQKEIRSELLENLGVDPANVERVEFIHHEEATAEDPAETVWYVWKVTFVEREGAQVPVAFKILAPGVQGQEKEAVLAANRKAYSHFNTVGLSSVPRLLASGEQEGLTFQAVELVPFDPAVGDGALLAEEVFRLWHASSDNPADRFLAVPLEPGFIHFFQGPAGKTQLRFVNFDWLTPAPTAAEVASFLHRSSLVTDSRQIQDAAIRVLGPEAGRSLWPAAPAGLEEAGQATFTLQQWQTIAADPDGSGLRSVIESYVPAPYVEKELEKAQKLIRAAVQKGMFLPDQPIALVRTAGRARLFMGHPDLPGIGGFSIDAATHQSIWMLVQMTNDGRVLADNLEPEYGPLEEFGIDGEDVLPENARAIVQTRPDWLTWAQSHTFENRWEGLVKGTLAVIRTKMMDPTDERRTELSRRGVRLLLSESDIPSGKGFSASSSIPAGIGLALNALWEGQNAASLILSPENLRQLDYAAYVVDDLAGVADITAILEGEMGQATVLWYDPDRMGQRMVFPGGFRAFAFDSNIKRLNHTSYSPAVRNYSKHIQTLTNISVPLAILWLRMLARTHPQDLDFLEEVLTAHWPSGVVRELTEAPGAAIRDRNYAARVVPVGRKPAVGSGAAKKRRDFVAQVMVRVPNEWTLGQIAAVLREGLPPTFYSQIDALIQEMVPLGAHEVDADTAAGQRQLQQMRIAAVIPMRQMALYSMNEIERGLKYLTAAEQGDSAHMLRLMKEAHRGDRALYDPRQPYLAGRPRLTRWGLDNPNEAFQRSLLEIDAFVDRFETEVGQRLGNERAVAARVSGAGLGGLIMGAVDEKQIPGAYQTAIGWLGSRRPKHEVIEVVPSAGARVVRLARLKPAAAGLEEREGRWEIRVPPNATRYDLQPLLAQVRSGLRRWLEQTPLAGADGHFELHSGESNIFGEQLNLRERNSGWRSRHVVALLEPVKNSLDQFADLADASNRPFLGEIKARLEKVGEGWVLELSDNGPGIRSNVLAKLFRERHPGGQRSSDIEQRRFGGDGAAFLMGGYGDEFLRSHAGRLEIDSHHVETGAHRLIRTFSPDQTQLVRDHRSEPGVTVRWAFSAIAPGQGLDPRAQAALKQWIQEQPGPEIPFSEVLGFIQRNPDLGIEQPDLTRYMVEEAGYWLSMPLGDHLTFTPPDAGSFVKIVRSAGAGPAESAGVEEGVFQIPAEVAAGRLVIFTPETAHAGLEALSAVRPPPQAAFIARDAGQEAEILAGLEEAGIALAVPIARLDGNRLLAEMILDIQMWAWAKSLETYVVNTLKDLFGIAPFLKFVSGSVRAWERWVEKITTSASA